MPSQDALARTTNSLTPWSKTGKVSNLSWWGQNLSFPLIILLGELLKLPTLARLHSNTCMNYLKQEVLVRNAELTSYHQLEEMGKAQRLKHLPTMWETWVWSLGQEDSPGKGNGNPLQYSCLENPMDRGALWATVHRVTKTRTRLSGFTFFLSKGERWLQSICPTNLPEYFPLKSILAEFEQANRKYPESEWLTRDNPELTQWPWNPRQQAAVWQSNSSGLSHPAALHQGTSQ